MLVVCVVFAMGCEPAQSPKKQPPTPEQQAVFKAAVESMRLKSSIFIEDGVLHRSSTRSLSGDLRPFWTVSGRLKNISLTDVQSVTLRIEIHKGTYEGAVVDSADLVIDSLIPAGAMTSFSRDIQIMPPDGNWEWNYLVMKAVPKVSRP